MERYAFAMEIIRGKEHSFREALGRTWPEITAFLDRNGLHNFSLWSCSGLAFGYAEGQEGQQLSGKEHAVLSDLVEAFSGLVCWLAEPGEGMELMYHDFGIVREDKSLIRHRMFMTRLKPGCAREYKARHQALIEARGGVPDPGPDSNFSIWSAGGYIFGYDEIDTTMEQEETPEAHAATVAWETRQLEIMDWITNDCDWLTGQVHPASTRLAWHL